MIIKCLTFYLGFSLVIKSKYKDILVKINDNASIQNQVFPKYKELSNSRKLNDVYSQIKTEDIDRIKALAPKEVSRQELFAEIVYLLQRQGVKVADLQVSKDGEVVIPSETSQTAKLKASTSVKKETVIKSNVSLPSGVGRYDVSLSLSGIDYLDLKRALVALENNLRLMDIRDLSFNPGASTASINLTTYYIKGSLVGETPVPLNGPASELNLDAGDPTSELNLP